MTEKMLSGEYADSYLQSHLEADPSDFSYKTSRADVLIVDQTLTNYSMLDVGCGTGGHLRFCQNHARVVGLDLSPKMVERANHLKSRIGIERAEFVCGQLESYPDEKFDAVNVRGVYGHYEPWSADHVSSIRKKVKDGGLLIASFIPAEGLVNRLKVALAPRRTVVIREKSLIRMMKDGGFSWSFGIRFPHATVGFFRSMSCWFYSVLAII